MSVYRQQLRNPRWNHAYERLSEEELPDTVKAAFDAFETRLRQVPTGTAHVDLELGSEVETFYPHYRSMKLESLGWAVATAVFLWLLGVGVCGLLNVVVILLVPEPFVAPAILTVLGGGALVVAVLVSRSVLETWRQNRVIREAPGPIAYGAFLLSDALVLRYPGWAAYFPRELVHTAEVEREAAHTTGGGSTGGPTRQVGARSDLHFHYLAADGESKRQLLLAGLAGHEPPQAARLRSWIEPDGEAPRRDPSFGYEATDLMREDYAKAWRSFKRRRGAAIVALIVPWLLFVALAFVDDARGTTWVDDLLGPGVLRAMLVLIGPGLVALTLFYLSRCPRCGKWPRQPLRSTDMSRCLHCGLPIFTKPRSAS